MYSFWIVCSAFFSFFFLSTVPSWDYVVLQSVVVGCALGGVCVILLSIVCCIVDVLHAWLRNGCSFRVKDWDCDDMLSCMQHVRHLDEYLAYGFVWALCTVVSAVMWTIGGPLLALWYVACVPFRVCTHVVEELRIEDAPPMSKPVVIDKGATVVPLDYTTYPVPEWDPLACGATLHIDCYPDSRPGSPLAQKIYEGYELDDGTLVGPWTRWHFNGQKKQEGMYVNGKKEGLWITWYDDGQMSSKVYFKDGEEQGVCTWWYEDGVVDTLTSGVYKDGEQVEFRSAAYFAPLSIAHIVRDHLV